MPERRRMSTERLLKAEDLLAEGSGLGRCELWDGVAVVREPSGGWAEAVAWRVMMRVGGHVEQRSLGWVVTSSQGFLLRTDPDRVLSPDGAFVSKERLPALPRRGFMPCAPDFALEVRSPDDSWIEVVEKSGIWIAHGVRVVWAIDPLEHTVVECRPGQPPIEVPRGGHADASPALPGLRVRVADLFAGL